MKRIFIFSICSLVCTLSIAQIGRTFNVVDGDGNDIKYEIISESEVRYDGVDNEKRKDVVHIVVPETISHQGKLYKVTELKPGCFCFHDNLREAIISNNIKCLPDKKGSDYTLGMFYGCNKLHSVRLPDHLEDIGDAAFKSCNVLKNIVIPKNVRSIGNEAFDYCPKLEEIIIPEGVETIGDRAFSKCESLKEIVFPNSVKTIGGGCLYGCKGLTSVKLPEGITELKSIDGNSHDRRLGFFGYCSSLERIQLPTSIRSIGAGCFEYCESLKSINIPEGVIELKSFHWDSKDIGGNYHDYYTGCFEYCKSLEEITLPTTLKLIDYYCFRHCATLSIINGLNSGIDLKTKWERDTYEWKKYNPFFSSGFSNKLDSIKQTFSYQCEISIRNAINEWQKKKEYETTAQWKQRVTEVSRQAKLDEIIEQERQKYIAQHTPNKFSGSIGNYDTDYNAFPVKVDGMNMIFVKVPSDVAEEFKAKWEKTVAKATPVYGVVDNNMAVLSCTFKFKGREYGLAQTFKNDDADNLALNLSPLELDLGNKSSIPLSTVTIDNSIDLNIPSSSSTNTSTFAVIVGNENYTQVAKVPFAGNDAKVFAKYCQHTLGLPIQNIRRYTNATFGTMLTALSDIKSIADAYEGHLNIIFFYAGHGVPNEQTHDAFLLPVDADGKQTEACYPVSRLYKELSEMNAKNVVVFMDACFSGSQRGDGMLASARGVALKAKAETPQGNMVVFSAATGDETAYPYKEKGHGLFTYFLLKKLQESKGDCTLGELGEYIQQNVRQQSVVINRKSQTPTVIPSQSLMNSWQNMKLR